MTDEKIIKYVMDSPENTNPSVLDSMLKNNKVQPDWEQNDETAPDYIKNRPFYTNQETYTVTWDGDITDKVSDSSASFYKVSDSTPDISELQEIHFVVSGGASYQYDAYSLFAVTGKYWFSEDGAIICILEAEITVRGMDFPETGIYSISYSNWYVSELEYTLIKRISRDYIFTPKFVVDATSLPTDTTGWGELCTALEDAYYSGQDIFLNLGGGGTDLKLTNNNGSYYLFLEPFNTFIIHAYILHASSNGGELKEYSLTATEIT